jgi:hypothetical protein
MERLEKGGVDEQLSARFQNPCDLLCGEERVAEVFKRIQSDDCREGAVYKRQRVDVYDDVCVPEDCGFCLDDILAPASGSTGREMEDDAVCLVEYFLRFRTDVVGDMIGLIGYLLQGRVEDRAKAFHWPPVRPVVCDYETVLLPNERAAGHRALQNLE